jgi:hypothetical protein
VLNGGKEQEEQRMNVKMIEIMQQGNENTLKFTECVTSI